MQYNSCCGGFVMEYVYPAVFHPNDDGSITITYPDLPGCISEGKSAFPACCRTRFPTVFYATKI